MVRTRFLIIPILFFLTACGIGGNEFDGPVEVPRPPEPPMSCVDDRENEISEAVYCPIIRPESPLQAVRYHETCVLAWQECWREVLKWREREKIIREIQDN